MNSLNETTDEPLDTSWLEKYDRILDIQNNYEKENEFNTNGLHLY